MTVPLRCLPAALLMLALAFAQHAAAQSKLWLQYVGASGNTTLQYATPANSFNFFQDSPAHVLFGTANAQVELGAPPGAVLTAGPYEQAASSYYSAGTSASVSTTQPNGCFAAGGRYVILDIAIDGTGTITSLAADFEANCVGGATIWGELRYNSTLPLTIEKPAGSTLPDAFAFAGQQLVPLSTLVTSDSTTIYGINAPTGIAVTDGEYSLNDGAFTSLPGVVNNRDRIRVRRMSSPATGTTVTATVTVGGSTSATFALSTFTPGAPQSGLVMDSVPGDYLGQGAYLFARMPQWNLALSQDSSFNTRVAGTGPRGYQFSASFRGSATGHVSPGAYEEAGDEPWLHALPNHVFSLTPRACTGSRGRFVILERDLAANPPRFAANFDQTCDGSTAPLFAEIRYNSTIPFSYQVATVDTQPDAMAFTARAPVRQSSIVYANYTRIYGVNAAVPISITGGEYSLNDGLFTAAPGTAQPRDLLRVRTKASPAPGGVRNAVLDAGGTIATFVVTSFAPGTPLTGLYYRSTPGDPIGRGRTRLHVSPPNVTTSRGFSNSFQFDQGNTDGTYFHGGFSAPTGSALVPGAYENMARFASPTAGALDFFGSGIGCNTTSGRMMLHEYVPNSDNSVRRLAADFLQRCEGTAPPLFGEFRVNSVIPFSVLLAPNPSRDLSGDGYDDLVWKHADGRHAIWLMQGLVPGATAEVIGAGTGWSATHGGDFDADGKTDLVWQHPDGRMAIYLMNGVAPAATQQLLNAGSGWEVTHTADLDGDGKSDLLFRHADGSIAAWLMNGTAMSAGTTLLGPGSGWSVTRAADLDGDGKADLVLTHADGRVALWLMNGVTVKSNPQILNAGSGWSVAHTADFNGDGRADLVWQHADGSIAVWLMNGSAVASGSTLLAAGSGWSVARTADFDGDGKVDLFFEHADGRAAIWLMAGLTPLTQTQILNAGSGWTLRHLADLDGDGKADILWAHTDGRVAAWLMNGTVMATGQEILGGGSQWTLVRTEQ